MAGGKQPGVMLYFTLRPGLKALSLEEKGMLLDAIFSYGEDGIEPAFNSPALAITWGFVQPLLDADKQRYQDRCKMPKKAIEARWNRVRENTDVYERIPLNEAYTNHTNSIHFNSNHSLVPPPAGTKKRSRFLSTTHFRTALRAGSRIRSKNACRIAQRIQKRPCKAGRRTLTSATGWTSIAGRTLMRFCSFRSPTHSGRATSCAGGKFRSSLLNSWLKMGGET